ncbi:MAG: glutamine synthetase [Ruminococcus sp.]|nr:glutamine synthetase [Ruminococcus sp.]MBQ1639148.1 glutamine synthetase [Ruminococcus sp.]MBQ1813910.1 glutamine synthetase [Ruminococcus sp.]MBQ3988772.1 glutamine synthetase [Ruminococcus sp.]MBQ5686355.1 glutamine synthetase [Ruminococcus sp.]
MNTTEQELMKYIEEEDVKFIRLTFCDMYGVQKNISIQRSELARAFEKGIGIDASYIDGFGGDYGKDIWLHPEPDTVTILPWRPEHGKVVRMFCTLTYADGTPIETDTRALLRQAVRYANTKGLRFHFKSEMQFYLFKTDDNGESTGVPYDNAGYMDIAPLDKGENVRREICLTLEQMGIKPESSHHEAGPGQNQIDFCYADPVTAADNTVTFLSVVRTMAAKNGLYADFSPKPLKDKAGSALHITISVKSNAGDDVTDSAIAGILHNIAGMTVFLNPTAGSFLRFGQHKAPKYITWSENNRAQLVSIRFSESGSRCAQLRSPDPEANPYLAYALMIYAVLDGIEQERPLAQPVDEDFWLSQGEKEEPERLPDNLEKARMEAKKSHLIQQFIPPSVIRLYCEN